MCQPHGQTTTSIFSCLALANQPPPFLSMASATGSSGLRSPWMSCINAFLLDSHLHGALKLMLTLMLMIDSYSCSYSQPIAAHQSPSQHRRMAGWLLRSLAKQHDTALQTSKKRVANFFPPGHVFPALHAESGLTLQPRAHTPSQSHRGRPTAPNTA